MVELSYDHPRRYEGCTLKVKNPNLPHFVMCGKCEGHGSYNLELDAYGAGNHFACLCHACDGHGYHHPDSCEDHKFVFVRKLGRCIEEMKCAVCSLVRVIDSSD